MSEPSWFAPDATVDGRKRALQLARAREHGAGDARARWERHPISRLERLEYLEEICTTT